MAAARMKPTARSPPITHATTSCPLRRRGRLPSGLSGPSTTSDGRGNLSEVTVSGLPADRAQVRSSLAGRCAAKPASVGLGAAPGNSGETPNAASAAPAVVSAGNSRVIDSGSQSAVGAMAPSSVSRLLAVGRWTGALARHRSTNCRTSAGT
jgi:hypothetical protein